MKRIGIVSELNLNNVNYGNRLQAFALNYYINNILKIDADSLIFSGIENKKLTKNYIRGYSKRIAKRVLRTFENKQNDLFSKRLDECNRFTLNNTRVYEVKNNKSFQKKNYDCFIVGSDVVWAQYHNEVSKIKFLDFKGLSNYKKISYAASFRKNWIPEENKNYLYKQLKSFDSISVREQSSIDLLKSINIENAVHVCDPTLLLDKKQWDSFAKPVDIPKKPFIFAYILGKSKKQREALKDYAKRNKYLLVTIPYVDMKESDSEKDFADVFVNDCSPEQWIWLIKNADLIVTDSFHGCVFANIFMKKYIVLDREENSKMNIRINDFLEYIEQTDKLSSNLDFKNMMESLEWDYKKINAPLDKLIKESKEYLNKALDKK